MEKIIEKGIYERLLELSSLSLQRKIWLNIDNDLGLNSSYEELICSLFDDFCFDEFVDKDAIKEGISEKVIIELKKTRDMLNHYNDINKSDQEILNDKNWELIADQAKLVLKVWKLNG